MNVLISPLGRSPGAVSGVYFALKAKGYQVEKVVTVGTSHPAVMQSSQHYLKPLFAALGVEYHAVHLPGLDLKHGNRVVMPHASMMGLEIENARAAGGDVHVAVTGGRSGMGALAALAAQFFGASYLWHLWVPAEIETEGDVEQLAGLISTEDLLNSPVLNPTLAGDEAHDLISLPFSDLSGLKKLLTHYAATGKLPDAASLAMTVFLQDAGLSVERLRQVYPAGATFADMEDYFALVNRYWQESDPRKRENTLVEIGAWMQRTGIIESEDRENLMLLLAANGSVDDLLKMVKKDATGIWGFLKENKDQMGILVSIAELFLKFGEIYIKSKTPTS